MNRKDSKGIHNKIEYSYSVYGENNEYSGNAWIRLHFSDAVQEIQLELSGNFTTLEDAEDAIIKSAQCWIIKNCS